MSIADQAAAVISIDPRDGSSRIEPTHLSSRDEVATLTRAAADAAPVLAGWPRTRRSVLLRAIADQLEAHREQIVDAAERETAIPRARLDGELTRSAYQARLFAEVLDDGGYLEATIDHARTTPMGPGPDLRRMLVPIGPVAVFGSSNFPLAFSVPGGDTISSLAAGCPVIVKAHSSHPATSRLCASAILKAMATAGAPDGVFAIVYGQDAGSALVADPSIRAVGFTGSLATAKILLEIIEQRPEPIPFFGELSSLNPLVITPASARARGDEIAAGVVGSVTISAGQLCTKPGLVFVPAGPDGDALIRAMSSQISSTEPYVLLNKRIASAYSEITADLESQPGVTVIARGETAEGFGHRVHAQILATAAADLSSVVATECFGPSVVVVRWDDEAELREALEVVPSSLTGTVHVERGDEQSWRWLVDFFSARSGRVVFNGYPTGVLVSWAQTHGGPWPATNSQHTSVGTTSIRRFLRPLTYQDAPVELLPRDLRDEDPGIPRRVDGRLEVK